MDQLLLARTQFAATTIFHFFFVPLTLGLSIMVAIMQTMYYKRGDEIYKKMTKFWGKLFLINFAVGVVTGIVQEFQFGMNWSGYSRYVGDIFGVPLAIEALLAFYLESTFIGVWIFGWNKLSKKMHLASIWLVSIASNLSALWILIANSWMQQPVGYKMVEGKPNLISFSDILFNSHVWLQYPHVFFGALATAGFFIVGISAYHIARKNQKEIFLPSIKYGFRAALIGSLLVIAVGHFQGQHIGKHQPMKLAAMEALWDSANPAGLSLFAMINEKDQKNSVDIKLPGFLSFMVHDSFSGEVKGIKDIQKQYEQKYGPVNYIPPVFVNYWSFRIMVGIGMAMIGLSLLGCFLVKKNKIESAGWLLKILPFFIVAPVLAHSFGWIVAEIGRQPWIVQGLLKVQDAVSPTVTAGEVGFTLIGYILLYGVLIAVDVYLLKKYAQQGATE